MIMLAAFDIQSDFWLTLLDTLLRLFSFSESFFLTANVDVGIEVWASWDILIGLFDELRAGENVSFHEAGRLLDGLSSEDTFVHSYLILC